MAADGKALSPHRGMINLDLDQFFHLLLLHWRKSGQPEVRGFVADALQGAHAQAKMSAGKSYMKTNSELTLELRERRRNNGMCLSCGKSEPDGDRSQKYCTVCLDKRRGRQRIKAKEEIDTAEGGPITTYYLEDRK